jgi:methylated-DNA-[protein]-cysteine S-methyltransferase
MVAPEFYAMDAPLGEIRVYVQDHRPTDITLSNEGAGGNPSESPPPEAVVEIMRALRDYFGGKDIPPDFAEGLLAFFHPTSFEEVVLKEVIRIPRGETRSYGEVAARVGKPGAARAVGGVMRSNPFPIIIPCHRVVKSDGSLGGYGGAERLKAWLLDFEGAPIEIVDARW